MSKRYVRLLKSQTNVKVVAQSVDNRTEKWVWLAAAVAGVVYFFSFFFSFTGGGAPAGN